MGRRGITNPLQRCLPSRGEQVEEGGYAGMGGERAVSAALGWTGSAPYILAPNPYPLGSAGPGADGGDRFLGDKRHLQGCLVALDALAARGLDL
jgi:hypothetical protein